MDGERFPRSHRLVSGKQFQRVFAEPKRSSDRLFTVLATGNDLGYPRLGMAIAKKRVQRAVLRNRIKRLVRESFRRHAELLGGVDLVVINRFDGRASGDAIRRSLRQHWRRLTQSGRASSESG